MASFCLSYTGIPNPTSTRPNQYLLTKVKLRYFKYSPDNGADVELSSSGNVNYYIRHASSAAVFTHVDNETSGLVSVSGAPTTINNNTEVTYVYYGVYAPGMVGVAYQIVDESDTPLYTLQFTSTSLALYRGSSPSGNSLVSATYPTYNASTGLSGYSLIASVISNSNPTDVDPVYATNGYLASSDMVLKTQYGTEISGSSEPSETTTCNYQIYVDDSPIDSSIFSNIESDPSATTSFSDKSFVLALDRSASHTVKMIDLTTGLVSSSADWKVNDSTTLPSGWTTSNGILTIPANATANSYNIEGTVGECSEDMNIRIVASSPTVPTIEDTGLGVGMTTGNITQYIAYYSNDGTFKTNETGTATGLPVSLTAKEGLAVSTADNKFIVSVPYDSAGYKFCVLDSSDIDDDGDPVVDALEGFVAENATTHYGILWGVRFPDGTGTAVRHYTRIPISDAGEYEITALACNGNLAKSDNVDTIYVQIVNTIRLTVLPVINVSWIACSYEG